MKVLLHRRERQLVQVNSISKDEIIAKGLELSPGIQLPNKLKESHQKICYIVYHHFRVSNDEEATTTTRRNALDITRRLLSLVDAAVRGKGNTNAGKAVRGSTQQHKSSDQASSESGKENVLAGEREKQHKDVASTKNGNAIAPRTSRNSKTPAPSQVQRRNSTNSRSAIQHEHQQQQQQQHRQQQQQQQQKAQRIQRSSSITQAKGKFSLSKYCQANDAYKETDSAGVSKKNTTATTNYAARNGASIPPPLHQPPPYQQKSPHLGSNGHRANADSLHEASVGRKGGQRNHLLVEEQRNKEKEEQLAQQKKKKKEEEEQRNRVEKQRRLALQKKKEKEEEQKREKQRQLAQQKKKEDEERKRLAEQKRVAQEREERKRLEEQKRLQQQKKEEEDERKRLEELKQKKKEEDERKRLEELKQKKKEEEERKRAAEKKKKEEEERKKRLAEDEERRKIADQRKKEEEQRMAQQRQAAAAANAEISAVMNAAENPRHSDVRVVFPSDNVKPFKWAGLHERPEAAVRYKPQRLTRAQAQELAVRLARWDPYWKVCKYVKCGLTTAGQDCSKGTKRYGASFSFFMSASDIREMKTSDWGVNVCDSFYDQQMRLIFRMLPVKPTYKNRADCHLWPKGTYVNLNGVGLSIVQRKQQAHMPSKWQGLSHPLDLTGHIRRPTNNNEVKILTYEGELYYFCIALCKYMAPSRLVSQYINSEPAPFLASGFDRLSQEQAEIKAKQFTEQTTLTLDDSDDDGGAGAGATAPPDSNGKFVFTLTCPFSKTILNKPVRGKQCKHYQCFDLSNFLDSNKAVNGNRWRCLVCEQFLSFYDLQLDGLVEHLAHVFRKDLVPSDRDRIEYHADGSYTLLKEKKQRYNNKKRPVPDTSSSSAAVAKKAAPVNAEPEIILLDDD